MSLFNQPLSSCGLKLIRSAQARNKRHSSLTNLTFATTISVWFTVKMNRRIYRRRERETAMEWNVLLLCVQTVFVIGQNKFGIFKFIQSKHSCSACSPSPLLSLPCQLFLDRFDVHIRFGSVKIPSHALRPLYRVLMYFYL